MAFKVSMEYIRTILSKNLQVLRKHSGLTQADLSQKLGTTPASYNRWENGINWPDPESIEKIALFYGVRSSRLFHDNDLSVPIESISKLNPREIISDLETVIEKLKR
jgi:transcriptional regulator with XRE-family HTH domain